MKFRSLMANRQVVIVIIILWAHGCANPRKDPQTALEPTIRRETNASVQPSANQSQLELEQRLQRNVLASNCETHLREITKEPHIAGSDANRRTADYVLRELQKWGYKVHSDEYHVLLPKPKSISVEMITPVAYSATITEPPLELDFDTRTPDAVLPYCAYSPGGDVEGPVVYANYGLRKDFEKLLSLGVTVKDSIVIARFGASFRGSKAALAEEFGASALLLYTDPSDDGFPNGDAYPKGPWRPSGSVQRGSILRIFDYPGDPGTPGRPSLPGATQLTYREMKSLPGIPTTCLSATAAEPFLRHLEGAAVPGGWQGALPFTYHLGGRGTVRARIQLEMSETQLTPIVNTVATWIGQEYPDEIVVIGNHRDGWVHGAVDPGTGTAVLLEAARVIAQQARSGSPPKRTIRFVTFDAEEFGMIGSTEWGEEHATELDEKCVAYVNVDAAVSGPNLRVAGVPSLETLVASVLSSIPGKEGTRLDDVLDESGAMRFGTIGCGSDYTVFLGHLGIPCIDISSSGPYGVYHSTYDTFSYVKRFSDPGFTTHASMSAILATTVSRLAGASILPHDFAAYGRAIVKFINELESQQPRLDLSELREIALKIEQAGRDFNRTLADLPRDALGVDKRMALNSRIHRAERKLLLENGLPGRPWFRHSIFAPDPDIGYGASPPALLRDALKTGDRGTIQNAATRMASILRGFQMEIESLASMGTNVSR